ncbi:glycosyltransferase involved in cell wall bisynthesis [Rhodobacter sp. JA431]|uniref:glycosyltransferase family 2 protein n=1 Tax=Rhodobacter sp. JA431 TaxID=570013 RepID=UPI000BC9B181|nr:glycosyltransferase family 2 protein [Rhodobacter sp. JA431]SOB99947.1 glycosyltransferase involved in cell wall bisynthesis [Rhodobacter sp. JA431]
MRLTVVILTKNEARHIERCIASVADIAQHVLVVDCGSTDGTVALAQAKGAEVLTNPWLNYATQMNWAIDHVPPETDWIMRLDADEFVTAPLATQIAQHLPNLESTVNGVYVARRMNFMGQPIRWGGVFPVHLLRLFRRGKGRCENRWMDEHILVEGETANFSGEIIDDNRNSLTWWTEKHNAYAGREVVDLLNLKYHFMPHETMADLRGRQQAGLKRWFKEHIYAQLPGGLRAFAYFLHRYVLRFGFLDGRAGTAFHVLQGFWYRYLVDTKLYEVELYMRENAVDAVTAIRDVLNIDLETSGDAVPKAAC